MAREEEYSDICINSILKILMTLMKMTLKEGT
jgi:hypothetical protein